jgi:hypothetical protein
MEDTQVSTPTYVGKGNVGNGTGSVAPTWPAGHQADDIGILFVQSCNQTVTAPVGWTECPSSPQGVGTAGAAGSTRLTAFYKRATSAAEAAPTVADSGDHMRSYILVFRGCETSGSPFDTSAGDTEASAVTACSIPGGTTTVAECLIIAAVANGVDVLGNQTTAGGWTNADLTNIVRQLTSNTDVGNGGGMDAVVAEKATAGTFGVTTVTMNTATKQGRLMLALKPPSGGGVTPVTEGGIYVASGTKATAGAVSTSLASMDAASVQARLTIAFKPPAAPPANLPPVVDAIPAVTGAVDGLVTFPIVAFDAEGDTLTYSLVDGDTTVPTGATLEEDEASGNFHFEWTPTSGQTGEWFFNVRVTDGTNTVDTPVTVTVIVDPDTTLRALAKAIAERAEVDIESAQALADIMDEQEQMNAAVLHKVRTLVTDLEVSRVFMADLIAQLEEETEPE